MGRLDQGTSPIVQAADGTLNYERAPNAEQNYFGETGSISDKNKYVALRDPETGKLAVWKRNPDMDEGGLVRVGVMDADVQRFVRKQGINSATADITATDNGIYHLARDANARAGKAVPLDMVKRMPEVLGNPSAVLWDKRKKNLSYVFDVPGDPKKGKFVIDVNFEFESRSAGDGKVKKHVINNVKTGGIVDRSNLMQRKLYEVIKGEL